MFHAIYLINKIAKISLKDKFSQMQIKNKKNMILAYGLNVNRDREIDRYSCLIN